MSREGTIFLETIVGAYRNSLANLGAIFPAADLVASVTLPFTTMLVAVTLTADLITAVLPQFPVGAAIIVNRADPQVMISAGIAPIMTLSSLRGVALQTAKSDRVKWKEHGFIIPAGRPISLYCYAHNAAVPIVQVQAVATMELIKL